MRRKSISRVISYGPPKFVIGKPGGLLLSSSLVPDLTESRLRDLNNIFLDNSNIKINPRFIVNNGKGLHLVVGNQGAWTTWDFETFTYVHPFPANGQHINYGAVYSKKHSRFYLLGNITDNNNHTTFICGSEDCTTWRHYYSRIDRWTETPVDPTYSARTSCISVQGNYVFAAANNAGGGYVYRYVSNSLGDNFKSSVISNLSTYQVLGVGNVLGTRCVYYGPVGSQPIYVDINNTPTIVDESAGNRGVMVAGGYPTFIGADWSSSVIQYSENSEYRSSHVILGLSGWSSILSCYEAAGMKYLLWRSGNSTYLAYTSNTPGNTIYENVRIGNYSDFSSTPCTALYHIE